MWTRSGSGPCGFGLLERGEVDEVIRVADRLGDHALSSRLRGAIPDGLRAWLYAARFPALYADSLLHGGGAFRYASNSRILERVLRSRGQYEFGTGDGSSAVAMEGWMSDFRPRPVLDYFFDRLLALAESHGVSVRFIAMPVNEATFAASNPRMRSEFAAYLGSFAARYPRLFGRAGPASALAEPTVRGRVFPPQCPGCGDRYRPVCALYGATRGRRCMRLGPTRGRLGLSAAASGRATITLGKIGSSRVLSTRRHAAQPRPEPSM